MAIYHYSSHMGKRHEGKNAVMAAAYFRREARECYRTNEREDFSDRVDLVYKNTFLPENAPEWVNKLRNSFVQDEAGKQVLDVTGVNFSEYAWNQIELVEKRRDSVLYFHHDVALPNELSKEAAILLVEEFAKEHLARDGIFCEAAIHWEAGNHHVHFMMPWRQLTEEGFGKKLRFGKKELSDHIKMLREAWAQCANLSLKQNGFDVRVDHRSHEERGIDLVPTRKVGKARFMQGLNVHEQRLAENEMIKAHNLKKIAHDPEVLITKIAQERREFNSGHIIEEVARFAVGQDVFSMMHSGDLADFDKRGDGQSVDYHYALIDRVIGEIEAKHSVFSEKTLKSEVLSIADNEEELSHILECIKSDERLVNLGLGEDGRFHFTTRGTFTMENDVVRITERMRTRAFVPEGCIKVDSRVLSSVSDQYGLNSGQRRALKALCDSHDLSILVGFAGTGKTYLLKAARDVWAQSGYQVYGMALSGAAAASLERDSGISSSTIEGFKKGVNSGFITLDEKSIVVMDEMGMTGLDDMHEVLSSVAECRAKFRGVGDAQQTQPIGRGAPMRSMIEASGCEVLDEVIRQREGWQREATIEMERGHTTQALDRYIKAGCVHLDSSDQGAMHRALGLWSANADNEFALVGLSQRVMVAFQNESVDTLNAMAREYLTAQGILDGDEPISFKGSRGEIELVVGDRIQFERNDYAIGVRNGQFASVKSIDREQGVIRALIDGGSEVSIDINHYRAISYGYAATIHKLQGASVERCVFYADSAGIDQHLTLVGATRHKERLDIVASESVFESLDDLKEALSRESLKDHVFDYPTSFSLRRGFETQGVLSRAVTFVKGNIETACDNMLYLHNYQDYMRARMSEAHTALMGDASVQSSHHQDAVMVADFADNRVAIANKLTCIYELGDVSEGSDESHVQGALEDDIYRLQLKNSELASEILQRGDVLARAMECNRIKRSMLEKALEFGERDNRVVHLVRDFNLGQLSHRGDCYRLAIDIKGHYGAVIRHLGDNLIRSAFLREVNHLADVVRYERAIEGKLFDRALIKDAKRYVDLDYEARKLWANRSDEKLNETEQGRMRLLTQERDKLAYEISRLGDVRDGLLGHFNIEAERLDQHVASHQRYLDVMRFAAMQASSVSRPNWQRQLLASRIKSDKAYVPHVLGHLEGGFKSINIESWHYERNLKLAASSHEFKTAVGNVRSYFGAMHVAKSAWDKVYRSGQSVHKLDYIKRAQGLSFARDRLAQRIVNNLEAHVGAIAFENSKLDKLVSRARVCDYLDRFMAEENMARKIRMASHIRDNLKCYGAGVSTLGLYQEVNKLARHYDYLHHIHAAPTKSIKDCIRLADHYQHKHRECGRAFSDVRTLERLGNTQGLDRAKACARALVLQRNRAAYDFIVGALDHGYVEPEIKGISLDYEKLKRFAGQHIAYNRIIEYLNARGDERLALASDILSDRSGYHFVYEKDINWGLLHDDARAWRDLNKEVQVSADTQVIEYKRFNASIINDALMSDAKETYLSIFGEPKKMSSREMRYSGGLIVSLTGSRAGQWYDFSRGVGGGPLKALQVARGIDFKEALAQGAALSGLSEVESCDVERKALIDERAQAQEAKIKRERDQKIEAARSIWDSSIDFTGTIAERYFKEVRGISDTSLLEIRYLAPGTKLVDYDDHGKAIEKISKATAAVMAVKDQHGQVTGVQRIYLDSQTARKNSFFKNPKLSRGVIESGAIIQTGTNGRLYIAEGPETAASIAMADKGATVLASLSVSNIENMIDVVKSYHPSEVILAKDNDGEHANTDIAYLKAHRAFKDAGIDIKSITPPMIDSIVKEAQAQDKAPKCDWNDVLIDRGIDGLRDAMGVDTAQVTQDPVHQKVIDLSAREHDINPLELSAQLRHSLVEYATLSHNAFEEDFSSDDLRKSKRQIQNKASELYEQHKDELSMFITKAQDEPGYKVRFNKPCKQAIINGDFRYEYVISAAYSIDNHQQREHSIDDYDRSRTQDLSHEHEEDNDIDIDF